MDITFHGAAGEVTGSCYLIRVAGYQLLLDCGLIQGNPKEEARNRQPFPFDPTSIDAVILSHAHIDHSGRLPLLVKSGFSGPIYTQRACRDLCRIMLRDSAFLQEKDAEWANRKRLRKGLVKVEPLYTIKDAQKAVRRFKALDYGSQQEILPGVRLQLLDAGHILGSSIVELWLSSGSVTRKLVFSGDLGHHGAPILRNPARIEGADLVLMESTYGDRLHRTWEQTWQEMHDVMETAAQGRGNILIPAFAVGRSQELIYLFAKHFDQWNLGRWQIFLDSPMAIEATEVYGQHSNLYDKDALHLFNKNKKHSLLPNLHFTRTPNQSMRLNRVRSGAIIIAGSGMCTGGRIRHHLKHNIWRHDCHLVIVGYQARGTLGRSLVEGASRIRLWGETIRVAGQVHTVGGLSAHADQQELLNWYKDIPGRPPLVLVHGEEEPQEILAQRLRRETGAKVTRAENGMTISLQQL
jgi:metallo-beta-lactamase family protein